MRLSFNKHIGYVMSKLKLLLSTLFFSTSAMAHTGLESSSLMAGIIHPLTGGDHLIMLMGFGVLMGGFISSLKARLVFILVALLSLCTGTFVGSLSGHSGIIEPIIMLSLLAISGILFSGIQQGRVRLVAIITMCAGFIFFHGYAHGVEAQGNIGEFSVGMTISASILMFVGVAVSRIVALRWCSISVTCASLVFLFANV